MDYIPLNGAKVTERVARALSLRATNYHRAPSAASVLQEALSGTAPEPEAPEQATTVTGAFVDSLEPVQSAVDPSQGSFGAIPRRTEDPLLESLQSVLYRRR